MQAWTPTLGKEWVEPQSGHPSRGVLCGGDKPPWLVGRPLGEIESLEKPGFHSGGAHVYWLAPRQGGERSALAAARFPTATFPCTLD